MPEAALTFATMNACPDENTLAQFARGQRSVAIEAHLDGCVSCRKAVAAAASQHTLPAVMPTTELTPGQRIGRYEVERELGRGGMGVVYMARDLTLDRHVAVKLLHARRDEAAQARLLREAQVMAKLAHPHVVPVFELAEFHGDLYLVMELVNGVTLDSWLKAERRSRNDIVQAFTQAGRGLAAAHAAGVVHRDFKPANVLMGSDGRVRVTDFGLSRPGAVTLAELPPMASPLVTREGTLVGTVAYMSPEQLDGKPATEHSDQFSFCVSLVEALSGQRPFDGETWSALAVSHSRKPVISRTISPSVREVLRRGLRAEPGRRFSSMTALLDALERAQTLGWRAVGLTALAAAAACSVMVLSGPKPPHSPALPSSSIDLPSVTPGKKTIMVINRDLREHDVITRDMIAVKQLDEAFVTESYVDPDSVEFIVNQKTNVPLMAGDALLWSQFETNKNFTLKRVLVMNENVVAGTPLTKNQIAVREMPEIYVPEKAVDPDRLDALLNHAASVPLTRGEVLLWTQFGDAKNFSGGWGGFTQTPLSQFDVVRAHKADLKDCFELFLQEHPTRHGVVTLRLKYSTEGAPFDVRGEPTDAETSTMVGCVVEAASKWRVHGGPGELALPLTF